MDEGSGNNALTSVTSILEVYTRTISCDYLSNQLKFSLIVYNYLLRKQFSTVKYDSQNLDSKLATLTDITT